MNEECGTTGGTDMDEAAGAWTPQGAAAVLQQARDRARRELAVRRPVLFLIWGVVVFVSYGAMWLSVRGQHPVPRAGLARRCCWPSCCSWRRRARRANVVDRAASGVGGRSEVQRVIFALALVAGFAALEIEKQALATAGRQPAGAAALFGQAIPLLVAGLVLRGQLRHRRPAGLAPADHRRLAAGRGGRRARGPAW